LISQSHAAGSSLCSVVVPARSKPKHRAAILRTPAMGPDDN
jgi:hypothetical protein